MLAAVDVQLGAVHVARLVGAQEIDGLGHLLRLAEAAHGDVLFHDLLSARRQDGRVDLARGNGVHADAAGAEVVRHLARQAGECGLRRGVGGAGERMHAAAGDGAHVDDRALGALEFLDQPARQHDRREKVDLEDALPVGQRHLDGAEARTARALGRNGRVVDKGVEAAALRAQAHLHLGDGLQGGLRVREIDLDVVLGPRFPRAVLGEAMPGAGDDAPAGGREALHRRVANAARGPGKDQRLPVFLRGAGHHTSLWRSGAR